MDFEKLLELRGCPTGSPAEWHARYASLVASEIRHRQAHDPKVSIVLVAWRSAEFVVECLDHIRRQNGLAPDDLEVILVDNGGLEAARPEFPSRVNLELRMTHNVGLCPARNVGVALARAPIVSFIDDDGLIEPDYFPNGLRHFQDPSIVAIRSKIVAKHHRYFTALADHYDRGSEVVDDCLVTEGSSLVRRDAYLKIGGFAEKLSPHEGIDFSYRLKKCFPDSRLIYAPDLVMRHDYYDSWRKVFRKGTAYKPFKGLCEGVTPETEADIMAFVRQHNERKFLEPQRSVDEKLARATIRALLSTARAGLRLARVRDRSYIESQMSAPPGA